MRCLTRLKPHLLRSTVIALSALPNIGIAQTRDVTKVPGQQPTPVEAPQAQPSTAGLKAGPLSIDGSASVSETFSDNVFVTKNNKKADWITTVTPSLTASLGDEHNELNLRGGAILGRYSRFKTENYDDYYANGDGRLQVGTATTVFGGASYDWTHESRESPDAVNGIRPTRYRMGDYYAGVLQSFTHFVLRAGGTIDTYAYDDVLSSGGLINNEDRNRKQYEVGARLGYRVTNQVQPFVQGYWVSRDYVSTFDDFGFQRSSSGYRAALGVSATLSSALKGEIYGGIMRQRYDDVRFADVTTPDFGGRLTWRPGGGTSLRASVDRSIEETTLLGSAGYIRTALGASVEQEVRPDLYLNGHLYYSQNDYLDVERLDHVTDAGLGFKYFLVPNLFFATDYTFLHRISNSAPADFYENRVRFRIGAQLAPAYRGDPRTFVSYSNHVAPGGFYIALLAGTGALTSAVDGPRGSDGSLTADFGYTGWRGDLAAGYGVLVGRVYLGIEADAAMSAQNWSHTGTGGTRVYSVDESHSFELAGRLGFQLDNNALLYGRAGIVATRFATAYQQNIHYVRPAEYRRGLRFGGGAEFPLVGSLFGRVEYTHTAYADYDVMPARTADNFANGEDLMRFGAVYHFASSPDEKSVAPFDYDGFYIGLQGGFGTLMSNNGGDRNPPQTLNVQRAGAGATGGILGGVGVTVSGIYLGAEAEAEVSNADWNIERDPNGRIYSVTKDYTLGASLRAGYVFDGNTLVYGRAGVADTRFKNRYNDEHGINYVTPSVTKAGLRLGGGVELPVGTHTLVRADYTWTRYGSYTVDYITGVDTFRNLENLFRVGVIFHL